MKNNSPIPKSVLAIASALALADIPAHAVPTVWNVNIGSEITTSDNYQGAATENTAPYTWNSFLAADLPSPKSLVDSAGSSSAVTFTVTGSPSMPTISSGSTTTGDEIFKTFVKGFNNTSDFTCTFANLTPGDTYDLVVYADWFWGASAIAITQTAGTGLAAPFVLNYGKTTGGANNDTGPLSEDTNPANVGSGTNNWNYTRLKTLIPDASGNLAFLIDGGNWPINGFQLVKLDLGDSTPPSPDPMTWATAPVATSPYSITMTATTATDPSGVEYKFTETSGNPGATDGDWQSSPVYTDTGLDPATAYTYRVIARDKSVNLNETTVSAEASATTDPADIIPPSPNPMTWAAVPAAVGESVITMTATTATDPNGVEYLFTETSGNPGASSSTWQDSPTYSDTGLTPGTTYIYTVTARDKAPAQTQTTASSAESATTAAADTTAPTPDPMTFDSLPAAISITKITMTATMATDPNGVEYYFDETSGNPGGTDSGWQDSPVYTDGGLTPGTSYTYTVKARDKSISYNESAASASASATTPTQTVISKVWNVNMGSEITTSDNFQGAAPENLPTGSNWNSVIAPLPKVGMVLQDAAGDSTAGVELDLSAPGMGTVPVAGAAEIFYSYLHGGTPAALSLKGLSTSKTYDIVIYSDWHWQNGDSGYPVTQTLGTGLSGTVYLNRRADSSAPNGTLLPLTEDTDPTNNTGVIGNWLRIKGLVPDINGQLGFNMGGVNGPFSGFQLVDVTADPTDTTPPAPNPMTWASAPAATSESSITMTAASATDSSAVEYLFTETSGNLGATTSAWQDSPVYTDTGLSPNTAYSYTVTARDKSPNQNTTAPSNPAASATTDPADTTAPTPDPMTFATPPTATSITKITMTATAATDPYGVEYYFTCTAGGGHDSGWQDSPVYTDSWLTPGTPYTYTVTARDKSLAHNPTAASASASATTNTQLAGEILWSTPQSTTAVTDVVTTGTLHAARHGDDGTLGATPLTVNGVEFAPGPILNKGGNSGTCLDSCPDELEALLDRLSWSYFQTTTTFTVTGLNPGAQYMIQIFLTDQRGPAPSGETFDDTVGNAVTLSGGSSGDTSTYGQFVIGTFTAKPDGTQTVHTTNVINAFQVRSAGGGSTYSTWATTNAGGQTPDLDFDNDGVENGIEYFMGQTGSSFTAMPALDGTNTITWPMSAAYSGSYEVQTSPNLAIWTNVDPKPVPSGGNLSYTLPAGLGKQFVRLLVTPTP